MRKILFFIVVGIIFFSCRKDNLKNSDVGCEVKYYDNTEAFDFASHDSMMWYAENGWNVNSAEVPLDDRVIWDVKINPNNSYEVIYKKYTENPYLPRQLLKYNFCNNSNSLITNEFYIFDWTKKDKIFYNSNLDWSLIYKMNSDGTNIEFVTTLQSWGYWIESSPNGELLAIEISENGLRVFTIITESGEDISNLEGNGIFLGWYDNEHVLIQYDGEVRKTNVYNKEEEFYLAGTYHYYHPNTERFLKKRIVNGFESWQVLDKNGTLLNETQPHIQSGFFLHRPKFLDENRIISVYVSREYNPLYHGMFLRQKAIIMNLDGSNARRVTPFEE